MRSVKATSQCVFARRIVRVPDDRHVAHHGGNERDLAAHAVADHPLRRRERGPRLHPVRAVHAGAQRRLVLFNKKSWLRGARAEEDRVGAAPVRGRRSIEGRRGVLSGGEGVGVPSECLVGGHAGGLADAISVRVRR
jgi:hypothetical protein